MNLYIILGIVILVMIVLGTVYIIWINEQIDVVFYEVETDSIQRGREPIKIVMLSDLHDHEFGAGNERLLQAVRRQKPDLILIAGDMFVKKPDFQGGTVLPFVKKLVEIAPVFYGNGNHEKKVRDFWEESREAFVSYRQELRDAGVKYLEDETCDIIIKGQKFHIAGLDLDLMHYQKIWHPILLTQKELIESIGRPKEDCCNILIAHNPQYFSFYKEWGADLIVSGHVHGGIMILPFLGGVIAPNYRLFPKYDSGKFQEGKSTMVLSRGLGVHSIKLRFFNKPELSVIYLKGK